MKKNFCLIFFILTVSIGYSASEIDSLKNIINTTENNSVRVDALFKLTENFITVNFDSTDKYLNIVYQQIDTSNDIKNLALYYQYMGRIEDKKYQLNKSLIYLKKSLSLYNSMNDKKNKAIILNLIGTTWHDSLQYDSAIYYFEQSFKNTDTITQKHQLAATYNNLANSYTKMNNNVLAIDNYFKALNIFHELGNYKSEAVTLGNIGSVNNDNFHYKEAITYIKKAIDLNKKYNNLRNLCTNYNLIAFVYKNLNINDTALYYYNESVKISEESNFVYSLAQSLHNIGATYIQMEEFNKAEKYIDKSLELSEDLSLNFGKMINLLSKADIYIHNKEFDKAENVILEAFQYSDNTYEFEKEAFDKLTKIYKAKHNYKKALEYLEKFNVINDTLEKRKRVSEFNEIKTRYETEQKETENKLLKQENRNQTLIINRQRILVITAILVIITIISFLVLLIIRRKRRKQHIIELKAKNDIIEKKSKELNDSNKTKDKLFSIVSHDLRSPFTGLLGFSSMLQEEIQNCKSNKIELYSNQIHNSTRNAFELLENLLTWSKAQQNQIVPNPLVINLYDTIGEIISSIHTKINEKNISLKIEIDKKQTLLIDKNILVIIIRNLVNNAIKFTPEGGRIIIGYEKKDTSNIVYVKDNGIGFDDIVKNKILGEENYTTKGTNNESGSGLGLMLIKDFINRINGILDIQSKPGEGSIFSIIFP